MLEGLLVFAYGIFPGQNDYVKDLGMVITLFGVVTLLAGWPVMRIAWFPIVFLVVALPWPELVYSRLASPLQQLAASAAVATLRLFGVTAHNFGTKIEMFDKSGMPRVLNVAEACAGLKSVMTFLMVAATVAFLSQRALWEKLVITASAVPIAIFCNVVRVCGQGLLDRYVSREWSEGFAHQFAGLVMVIPGFFLILLVGWLLDQMFIEEVEGAPAAAGKGPGNASAGAATAVNRSKRLVVEVPRKKLASGPATPADQNSNDEKMPIATPGVPVSAPAPAPAAAVTKQSVAPATTAPNATPAAPAKPAQAPAPRQSTLKAPSAGAARPTTGNAAPAPAAGSTLKPSSKPVAPRGVTSPASQQPGAPRPSTLKPAAPKSPGSPQQPQPQQKQQTQGTKPPAAPRPALQQPPQQSPRPSQQQGGTPKSE
jgi:exosortase